MPCSEVHWKILPAVSRQLALCLEKEDVPRAKIAHALGSTPAAVSQYISGKRGGAHLGADAKRGCALLAKRMAGGKVSERELNFEISKLVVIAKGSHLGKRDPCIICATAKVKK